MSILQEADKTINGERQDQYGSPEHSFEIIADFWSAYLYHAGLLEKGSTLLPIDVARMMSLFKHARMLGQGDKRDNYLDAIGYLAIGADRILPGRKGSDD